MIYLTLEYGTIITLECGSSYTNRLENMFKDIEISRELMVSFHQVSVSKHNTVYHQMIQENRIHLCLLVSLSRNTRNILEILNLMFRLSQWVFGPTM